MTFLTNIISKEIDSKTVELDGKILTLPALIVTEGSALVYGVDVDIGMDQPLRNVPIAAGASSDISYASINNAVRLKRSASGRWEVYAFSKEAPGTRVRVPVTIPDFILGDPSGETQPVVSGGHTVIVGTPVDLTLTSRFLTYGELATTGAGYGSTRYGAVGIYQGGVLQEVA